MRPFNCFNQLENDFKVGSVSLRQGRADECMIPVTDFSVIHSRVSYSTYQMIVAYTRKNGKFYTANILIALQRSSRLTAFCVNGKLQVCL